MPDYYRAFFLGITMAKYLTSLLVLLLLSCSFQLQAHKMKSAFTIVLFNERSGYLEVMHRIVLHDAEEAAWKLYGSDADIISDSETQEKVAQHAISQFKMKDQDGNELPLKLLGYQNDAGYFWVYQDMPLPKNVSKLRVQQKLFQQIWAEQINIVNIEGKGEVQSLTFSAHDGWQSAYFDQVQDK